MPIDIKVRGSLELPTDLGFDGRFWKAAAKTLVTDLVDRVNAGVTISGGVQKANSDEWAAKKRSVGLSTLPLRALGERFAKTRTVKYGVNEVRIGLSRKRMPAARISDGKLKKYIGASARDVAGYLRDKGYEVPHAISDVAARKLYNLARTHLRKVIKRISGKGKNTRRRR